jgi:hypothetical protein
MTDITDLLVKLEADVRAKKAAVTAAEIQLGALQSAHADFQERIAKLKPVVVEYEAKKKWLDKFNAWLETIE